MEGITPLELEFGKIRPRFQAIEATFNDPIRSTTMKPTLLKDLNKKTDLDQLGNPNKPEVNSNGCFSIAMTLHI